MAATPVTAAAAVEASSVAAAAMESATVAASVKAAATPVAAASVTAAPVAAAIIAAIVTIAVAAIIEVTAVVQRATDNPADDCCREGAAAAVPVVAGVMMTDGMMAIDVMNGDQFDLAIGTG